jgi:hypothetical protein
VKREEEQSGKDSSTDGRPDPERFSVRHSGPGRQSHAHDVWDSDDLTLLTGENDKLFVGFLHEPAFDTVAIGEFNAYVGTNLDVGHQDADSLLARDREHGRARLCLRETSGLDQQNAGETGRDRVDEPHDCLHT